MADHIRSIQEGLLVKSLFQHAESIKPQHASDHDAEKPEAVPWHQFLDELCHLCQFRRGGEDITAIAVERTKKGHRIFWIATNSGMKPESDARKIARKEHLAWILKTITAPRGWNVEMEKEDASELVFAEAIRKSPQRIKNYQHRLLSIVNEIDTQGDNSGRTASLLASLRQITGSHKGDVENHREICLLAHGFRSPISSVYKILQHQIQKKEQTDDRWRRIRHYIGRLAAWQKAASFVAMNASHFTSELRSYQVSYIPSPVIYHVITVDDDIDAVFSRVCPSLERRESATFMMRNARDLLEKFKTKKQEPCVHAEAAIACHFDVRDLKFAMRDQQGRSDRYIGCSKPSCYCCRLYFEKHLGDFSPRKSSGNAYMTWYPPLMSEEDLSPGSRTVRIMRSMVKAIQQDVLSDVEKRNYGVRQQFDSTTGKTVMIQS